MLKKTNRVYQFPGGKEYPIRESNASTLVKVNKGDLKGAIRRSPYDCAIAKAFKRAFNSPNVMISGTVAYVVTKVRGQEVALKFSVDEHTREAVKEFDEKGTMADDGYRLAPMYPSQSMAAQRIKNRNKKAKARGWGHKSRKCETHRKTTWRHLTGHVRTRREK